MKSLVQYIKESQLEMNGFVILKPEFLEWEDPWLDLLKNKGWQIIQKKKCQLSNDQCKELYKMHKGKPFYDDLCKYMSSDKCICCSCYKKCDNPIKEMKDIKDIVREKWGIDDMKNAMHSSDSLENVNRENNIIMK